jgi:hypothetical protein
MNIFGQDKRRVDSQVVPIAADFLQRLMVNASLDGDLYRIFFPSVAVGANLVFLDLWNGSSDLLMQIGQVVPIADGSVAVVGTLGVNLFLTRTTAIGTGGTAAVAESTALTATPAISKIDPRSPTLPATITARASPTGGGTAGAVIGFDSRFSEETAFPTYIRNDLLSLTGAPVSPLIVPAGTGIRVIQGAVASVGNIAFGILFSVRKP